MLPAGRCGPSMIESWKQAKDAGTLDVRDRRRGLLMPTEVGRVLHVGRAAVQAKVSASVTSTPFQLSSPPNTSA